MNLTLVNVELLSSGLYGTTAHTIVDPDFASFPFWDEYGADFLDKCLTRIFDVTTISTDFKNSSH